MMKKVMFLFMAAGLISVSQAVIVDDFESYALGEVEAVASPPWVYEVAGSALGTIAADAGNQYITFGDDSGDWRNLHRPSGMSISTTGILSFDICVDAETAVDHAVGLSDDEGIDWYDDLGPYVRVTDDTAAVAGVVSLDTRDDGGFVDDIATLNVGQWYNIMLVIDTSISGGQSDIYVDGNLVYTLAGFRKDYVNPLDNVVLYSGTGTGTQVVRVDNIEVIPEPATLALLGLGGLLLRRKR